MDFQVLINPIQRHSKTKIGHVIEKLLKFIISISFKSLVVSLRGHPVCKMCHNKLKTWKFDVNFEKSVLDFF